MSVAQRMHFYRTCSCCILTLDRAVNLKFSAQDAPVKISGSNHVVEQKCVGVMKWCMQMPTRCLKLEISLSLQRSVDSADREPWPLWAKQSPGEDQWSKYHRKRRRKALKITQRGMVKRRRIYGSVWQSVFVSLRLGPSVSLTSRRHWPLSRIKSENYIFTTKYGVHFFHHGYITFQMTAISFV